jgi:putative membrane protein
MRTWLARWIVNAVALAIVAHLNIGVKCESVGSLLVATLAIGFANSVARPILQLLTMPLNCLTFGLFGYVISFLLFYLVGQVVDGFSVNVTGAIVGSLALGLVSSALSMLLIERKR